MKRRPIGLGVALWLVLWLVLTTPMGATIVGNLRGIVHDPQHRPIEGARVTIHSRTSDWSRAAQSNADGEFEFNTVPVGEYSIEVVAPGFATSVQQITVTSGSAPVLHFPLDLAATRQEVQVSASPELAGTESSTTESVVNREEISRTPGADRTNSLAMITDYVPGAVVVHDQLHLRGGHQVSWFVDGVPVPNTNIASNVGPQFDPKDVDYIEAQRGGYSAEYGDRTYGVFNVVTRSGFERNNEAEMVAGYGSFHSTNDQISFGSHTERFAYYASVNGDRSDLGLMTPAPSVLHDQDSGLGGFTSLIFNATPGDQVRLVSSLRRDHYQIPNTPEQQLLGIRDLDRESDAFVNFSWVHTAGPGLVLTLSPFYHFNRADYVGGQGDTPLVPDDNRASNYAGFQATLAAVRGRHNVHAGVETFGQHDNTSFGLRATDGSGLALKQQQSIWGNVEAVFLEDQVKVWSWLTLDGGARLTRYSGSLTETRGDPRIGGVVRLPGLGWALRASYSRYYQPPPLDTVSGPLLNLALEQGFGFLPLHGERDEQHEFGLTIPFNGWVLDVDSFRTRARNFFDHDVLGNSNIFLPLTIEQARIRGWESTLRSPRLFHRAQIRLAYSHQYVQGRGAVTGGLTDFSPPAEGYFFLDHDQRNTLSGVLSLTLPRRSWATANVSYGSGFLNGDGPAHLPAHTTFDVALGKSMGENWSVALTSLNASNRRYLVDNSNTFGGTHYVDPREISVEVRWRFHY
ncbi:MAG: TonB-dependent receptor [Acidobacteria bacterium]|nr:MAG: TonB-dependent receptor [Acidobacteriota bacterium]